MIPLLARKRKEPEKHRRRHRISRWDCAVRSGFHAVDEPLMVMAGEKASAVGLIPEMRQQALRDRTGLIQIPAMGRRFKGIEQRRSQPGRIVHKPIQTPLSPGHRPKDAAVRDGIIQEERERAFRGGTIGRRAKRDGGIKECGHHHRIPTGQDILVPLRFHPPFPRRQQFRPRRTQQRFGRLLLFRRHSRPPDPI